MTWSYNKLWNKIEARNINKSRLRDEVGFRLATLSRLSKNNDVSMEILARICHYLDCNIGNIVEFVPDRETLGGR